MTVLKATYDYETEPVTTTDELAALLDKVASLPLPTWLELTMPEGDALLIGLGRDFSSMRFIDGREDGSVYHSATTLESSKDADFQFGKVPTHMDPGSAIAVADARAAAIEFLKTGHRPEGVEWLAVEAPYVEPEPWDDALWEPIDPGEPSTPPGISTTDRG